MWVLNFAHPLSEGQKRSIEHLTRQTIHETVELKVHFDQMGSFAEQAVALIEQIPLIAAQWQQEAILINPPSLSPIACLVLAELHGRMGYFPPIVRLRPVSDQVPLQFEVAEIINLEAIREKARQRR